MGVMAFDAYLIDLLPDGVRGIYVIVENTCGGIFTYRLHGNQAEFLGVGDLHESFEGEQMRDINFNDNYKFPEVVNVPGHCVFSYRVYSSELFNSDYASNLPLLLTCVVAVLFLIMAVGFVMLMRFVELRHNKVVGEAAISNAIVSSLSPSSVRKRLFADRAALLPHQEANEVGKNGLRSFLNGAENESDDRGVLKAKPIADLFRDATIMCKCCHWSTLLASPQPKHAPHPLYLCVQSPTLQDLLAGVRIGNLQKFSLCWKLSTDPLMPLQRK